MLKTVNSQPTSTHGVAWNVRVKISEWPGTLDFSVIATDDYPCVLGVDFIDQVKAITLSFANSMCILEENNTYTVSMTRGKSSTSTFSALHLSKGVERLEPTLLNARIDGLRARHEINRAL